MVWAKGQGIGHYFHSLMSAMEASELGNPWFYQINALKYHGSTLISIYLFICFILSTNICEYYQQTEQYIVISSIFMNKMHPSLQRDY